MSSISYEIVKKLGTLGESSSGWTKQLNLISWSGRAPKYDLRDWSPGGEKMGKGVTLSLDDLKKLKQLLNQLDELN
ncbi:PC4/YdbC family ssDNA-binding protein [Sporolactobacillus sp. CPB3-1]|uniref:PC4/YdbC family ssDNA-binding protein n=1 Tax=Sporolactobacillus mangiferae TaxID=2940498 RepID=A0ABT0M9I5_9BACL|nr:PC4/YdbC family ssDNA-binding protein [Sporolactobacillus mangiferae]MCL1631298.1 PC4/YdbC family ssDNA-binding protein [Sporolactobacillus mangiferae]